MEFRKYDLNQAKDGDRVMIHPDYPNTANVGTTFVGSAKVAIRWADGRMTLFDKVEKHFLIHKPVYLLDGKPVYVGDTVYCGSSLSLRSQDLTVAEDRAPDRPPEVLDPEVWFFTLKPKALNINGFEVPYPETEAPEVGTTYWVASLDGARKFVWEGDGLDLKYLHEGRVHPSEGNAQIHVDALLSFFKVKY